MASGTVFRASNVVTCHRGIGAVISHWTGKRALIRAVDGKSIRVIGISNIVLAGKRIFCPQVYVLYLMAQGTTHAFPSSHVFARGIQPITAIVLGTSSVLFQVGFGLMGIGAPHGAVAGEALVFNKTRQFRKQVGFFLHLRLIVRVIKSLRHHAVAPLGSRADVLAIVLQRITHDGGSVRILIIAGAMAGATSFGSGKYAHSTPVRHKFSGLLHRILIKNGAHARLIAK